MSTVQVRETEVVRPQAAEPRRLVDELPTWLVNAVTALGFTIPTVAYFWVIAHFGVNVLFDDQLTDVNTISASKTQVLPWGTLWAPHNHNRMLFPHLLDIVLADTVHFNTKFEEFLSAILLVAATALLILAHKRRSSHTPWLYYCPVAVLSLSLVQYQNALWGFQIAWYIVLFAIALAIFLIDRITLSTWALIGAIAAGVVGSYSLLQGLFIWPVGLILLYHRRRGWPAFVAWIASALATGVLYLLPASPGTSGNGFALQHPWASFKFFLFAIGDIVGVLVKEGANNSNVILVGLVILGLAAFVVICYGLRRDENGAGPIGVALIVCGLLFAGSVTQGRIFFGYWGASASRYTTFDLLILIGIYLCVLGKPNVRVRRQNGSKAEEGAPASVDTPPILGGRSPDLVLRAIRWVVALVIVTQIVVGLGNAVTPIKATHQIQLASVRVSRHPDQSAARELSHVAPFFSVSYIRQQLRMAEKLHISLYYPPSS
jgi:hypothetical protein